MQSPESESSSFDKTCGYPRTTCHAQNLNLEPFMFCLTALTYTGIGTIQGLHLGLGAPEPFYTSGG